MTDDKPDVVLIRVRLADQPGAVLYAAGLRSTAERLAADAARTEGGDQIEVLPADTFVMSAAVTPAEVKDGLKLLGIERPDGMWVQPPGTGQAAQRN